MILSLIVIIGVFCVLFSTLLCEFYNTVNKESCEEHTEDETLKKINDSLFLLATTKKDLYAKYNKLLKKDKKKKKRCEILNSIQEIDKCIAILIKAKTKYAYPKDISEIDKDALIEDLLNIITEYPLHKKELIREK